MVQAINVREMIESDIDTIATIYAEELHPNYISFSELAEGKAEGLGQLSSQAVAIFREQLFSLLGNERRGFFIAALNGQIIGFALASLHETEAKHEECWLDDIVVKKEWQNHSVGATLVQWVLDWSKQKHAKYVLLESGMNNDSAHHLFEHLGFQPISIVFWQNLSK